MGYQGGNLSYRQKTTNFWRAFNSAAMAARVLQSECKKGNYNATAFENPASFVEQKAYVMEIKPALDKIAPSNQ